MKAIILEAFGGPDNLIARDVAQPRPGPSDVVVRVQAAGVCHHDVLHRAGKLPGAKTGVVLGHEIAGEIVDKGSVVDSRAIGDRVVVYQRRFCGVCRSCLIGRQDMCKAFSAPAIDTEGGYAELIAVPASMTIPFQSGIDWPAAALACCPIATSLRAIRSVGQMQPGDTVAITGASGGLGVHQIQIVRALGGYPIAITSSPDKAAFLRSLGAAEVVVSPDLTFASDVWNLTGKRGVDLVIDNLGQTLAQSVRCVTTGGAVVVLGNLDQSAATIQPGLLIARRIRVQGSGMAPIDEVRHALAMIAGGLIKPVISAVLPFDRVSDAHRLLDNRQTNGRVVMQGW
ncbi:MAG: alcohol dehydrogenase catalytic domain-containing protein [Betaproteobacteria bacterium]